MTTFMPEARVLHLCLTLLLNHSRMGCLQKFWSILFGRRQRCVFAWGGGVAIRYFFKMYVPLYMEVNGRLCIDCLCFVSVNGIRKHLVGLT